MLNMSEKTFTKKTFEIFEKIVSQCQNILLRCPSTSWRIFQNTLSKSENVVSPYPAKSWRKRRSEQRWWLRFYDCVPMSKYLVAMSCSSKSTVSRGYFWAGTTFSSSQINNHTRARGRVGKAQQSQITKHHTQNGTYFHSSHKNKQTMAVVIAQ